MDEVVNKSWPEHSAESSTCEDMEQVGNGLLSSLSDAFLNLQEYFMLNQFKVKRIINFFSKMDP